MALFAYPLGELLPVLLYGLIPNYRLMLLLFACLSLYIIYLGFWYLIDSPVNLLELGQRDVAFRAFRELKAVCNPDVDDLEPQVSLIFQNYRAEQGDEAGLLDLFREGRQRVAVPLYCHWVVYSLVYFYLFLLLPSIVAEMYPGQELMQNAVLLGSVGAELLAMYFLICYSASHSVYAVLSSLYFGAVVCFVLYLSDLARPLSLLLLKGIGCAVTSSYFTLTGECFTPRFRTAAIGLGIGLLGLFSFVAPYFLVIVSTEHVFGAALVATVLLYKNIDGLAAEIPAANNAPVRQEREQPLLEFKREQC